MRKGFSLAKEGFSKYSMRTAPAMFRILEIYDNLGRARSCLLVLGGHGTNHSDFLGRLAAGNNARAATAFAAKLFYETNDRSICVDAEPKRSRRTHARHEHR